MKAWRRNSENRHRRSWRVPCACRRQCRAVRCPRRGSAWRSDLGVLVAQDAQRGGQRALVARRLAGDRRFVPPVEALAARAFMPTSPRSTSCRSSGLGSAVLVRCGYIVAAAAQWMSMPEWSFCSSGRRRCSGSEAVAHHRVDVLRRGEALLDQRDRLAHQRVLQTVAEETGMSRLTCTGLRPTERMIAVTACATASPVRRRARPRRRTRCAGMKKCRPSMRGLGWPGRADSLIGKLDELLASARRAARAAPARRTPRA